MSKQNITKSSAYSMVIMAAILWGLIPLVYKESLAIMGILIFLAGRFTFGALSIFTFERSKFVKLPKHLILPILIYGIMDGLVINYLYSVGVQQSSILHIALISLLVPFFIYYFASILLKEKVHKTVIVGAIFASIGLMVIVFGGNDTNGSMSVKGDLIILLCAVLNALVIVTARNLLSKKQNRIPAEQLAFMEYSVSALVLLILIAYGILSARVTSIGISVEALWLMFFAGTVVGAIPIVFYYRAAKVLPAERLADTNFISPLIAMLTGIFVLGEQITNSFILGISILLIGLMISNNKIHPVTIAHRVYADEQLLLRVFRQPQKAYAYITKHINR